MLRINLKKITEDLIPSFYLAGKESIKLSGKNLKITIKKDNTPVTNGDLAVDKILREREIVQVQITYRRKDGSLLYPNIFEIPRCKLKGYPEEVVKGVRLMIVPIDAFKEIIVR